MAETSPGVLGRTWSRAPLIARLTTAGLVATFVLAFAFGSGLAFYQKQEAQAEEQQRSLKEARAALRKLDLDILNEKTAEKPIDVARSRWEEQLHSLRD